MSSGNTNTETKGEDSSTVTTGMAIAASWAWRFLAVVAAVGVLLFMVGYLSEVTIPIAVALLLSALLTPVRQFLVDKGWRQGLASATVFVVGFVLVITLVTVVIRQFASGAKDLVSQAGGGLDKVQNWLVTGPLKLSQDQINSAVTSLKKVAVDNQGVLTTGAISTATSVAHIVTGLVLALFTLFFFLRDGRKIWTWMVGLMPLRARARVSEAADRSWATLTGYVRATVLVAAVDATGIGLGLLILGVPLAIPLTALVFLASFIPIIGALISGLVAVLVALVTVGLVKAIIVLAVVIAVQQLEGHVLQPVLLGRAVSLHPLAVVLAIASGVILLGVVGGLLAVPIAACANAAVKSLAATSRTGSTVHRSPVGDGPPDPV
ncbi:putative PurR-regulated permease PerM [Nakamurella sp. UYEF19]|uniref:AI-2E family transporter n=1 Tax=Nakamurella sp. UYEF19 TaxID=1756392 RepID=UPI00339A8FB3